VSGCAGGEGLGTPGPPGSGTGEGAGSGTLGPGGPLGIGCSGGPDGGMISRVTVMLAAYPLLPGGNRVRLGRLPY